MAPSALPPVVDRAAWREARDALLTREKEHTRAGDALAAARRRLPMTAVPDGITVVGADGEVPFLDVFEGRSQLIAYFHMWHTGRAFEDQCEGCTFTTCHMGTLDYLHARDVTYAVLSEGPYPESAAFREFMGYPYPWYSAERSDPALLDDRGFGFIACYLRDGDRAYETYWTTDRGTEGLMTSYAALDLTAYGRQEAWEDSPQGWPRIPQGQHPWRLDGRPTAQWSRTSRPVASEGASCH